MLLVPQSKSLITRLSDANRMAFWRQVMVPRQGSGWGVESS